MADSLSSLLALAEAYGVATGLSLSTVSERVLHGGNRLRDIQSGKTDIGVRRLRTAIQWFSDHWPEGLEWPRDIERPSPSLAAPLTEPAA